jgi:hypothetical protein
MVEIASRMVESASMMAESGGIHGAALNATESGGIHGAALTQPNTKPFAYNHDRTVARYSPQHILSQCTIRHSRRPYKCCATSSVW